MEADRVLILEDARSISQRLSCTAHLAQNAAASLDARIEEDDLDGLAKAAELHEVLEQVQILSLETSEHLDAYQRRLAAR